MNLIYLKKSLRYICFKSRLKFGYLNFLLFNFKIIYFKKKLFFYFFIKSILKKKIKKYIYLEFLYNNYNNRIFFIKDILFDNKFFKDNFNLFNFIFLFKKIGFKFFKKNIIFFNKNKFIFIYFFKIFFFNNINLDIVFYIY